jgi:hypothetical protein
MPPRKRTVRKQTLARVHSVSAKLSVEQLAKAGSALTLEVFGSGGKLGELEIGRGSLFWTGRNRQKSKRIRWPDFATMMDDLAYGR